ncbi:Endoplasmic reticulum metallopeptidase 1 [Morus notabilis]|uniref:Endoplasmic reticulum metallopeptidase 1 n=1 Tax=Morus notabilis TaxID=981085 RepID=W9S320_9ROSA|nr:endoplasmic reticulum metallopeptidase 1 [Morus notabilis]EXC06150.1 Endoplasmic reticulum metallopeptidase 1 [Morus notabilis]
MASRFSPADVSGFKFLLLLAVVYGLLSMLVYSIVNMKFIVPLEIDAPLDRFSEARAIEHVRFLSKEIDGRQEGRPGLREAARYIKGRLGQIKERSGLNTRIEIEETIVNGSFNMMFLGHSISLTYRDHINVIMRISSANSQDSDASVMLNGHFDSPLDSPGAGDCGSCVASMLEVARLIVDSGWIPPRPIIFLFNGAEELFMLGTHGFMRTHKWRDTIGAFINVEASGTGGPDLVCQSGPGPWPSEVYAQSAIYPMAHSAAQDVFPVIPGDTDYRIFSQDYGNIPGLDIIFLLGGYFYHTSYDTVERLLPGSIQARGDNLFSIIKAFANSSKLKTAHERESHEATTNSEKIERAVFFDYLTWFMIYYSRRVALLLHNIPLAIFFIMPVLHLRSSGLRSCFATLFDFMKGMLFYAAAVIFAIIFPIIFSILRLLFTSHGMNWFAHPYLAFMMFIPCALVGLSIPRVVWSRFPLSQDVLGLQPSKEALSVEARFWGTFGLYAALTTAYLVAGLSGGFLTFILSASMLLAWISFCFAVKSCGHQSFRATMFYLTPQIPFLAYSVYFGGFLVQFSVEKMGMMGSSPPPYGYFIPDVVVAAVVGVVTGWCVGPLLPVCGHWLARRSIMQFLLHLTILGLALSSQFFPYTKAAPKRVVFQHTFLTTDSDQVVESNYEFSVVDSNSLLFLFKHAPEVAKELQIGPEFSFETAKLSHRETWMGLFPVSFLFSRSLKFPAKRDEVLKQYRHFPLLTTYEPHTTFSKETRRIHLELSLGSLEEVWVTVLNITGPLSGWSFADNVVPAPEILGGGPPSYICRLSGASHQNWTFWLEASSGEDLRVEVAVLDQHMVNAAKKLKGLFPDWVDVVAYSSYLSSYVF